jgi:hypothetical protein
MTFPVTIRWIPVHIGIAGNKAANKAIKEATKDKGESLQAVAETLGQPLLGLLRLTSAAKTIVRREAHLWWEQQWESTKTSVPTKCLIAAPTKHSLWVYAGLQKAHSSVLMQLHTG